jgi:hypothetical protein
MRKGKRRIVISPASVHKEILEADIHQALSPPGSLTGTGNWLTDILHSLCQLQKSNNRPVFANLPGLHWIKANEYPSGNREKDVSSLAITQSCKILTSYCHCGLSGQLTSAHEAFCQSAHPTQQSSIDPDRMQGDGCT